MSRVNAQKTGQLIRQQRTAIGMTQGKLADELNVTNKAISKWENGDGLPDISILIQLAAKLHITTDELLAGHINETEDNDLQIEQTDNLKMNDKKEKLASKKIFSNLVFLSFALCLNFYLALSQITGQFSSWLANQFIIDNGYSASIITGLPGLLLTCNRQVAVK